MFSACLYLPLNRGVPPTLFNKILTQKEVILPQGGKYYTCDCRFPKHKNFVKGIVMKNFNLHNDLTDSRLNELIAAALQIGEGVIDLSLISASDISVEDDLADLCREPRCKYYGVSANCPPYVSGPSGFRNLQKKCKHAIVVKIPVPTASLLSHEQSDIMKLLHEIVANIERTAIKLGYSNSKAYAGGSCKELFCQKYDDCRVLVEGAGKCRHQSFARPPVEAYGINVNELAKTAGLSEKRDLNKNDPNKISMGAVYGLVLII